MKNSLLILLVALFAIQSCSQQTDVEPVNPVPNAQTDFDCEGVQNECDLVFANNEFGFNIFKKLHLEEPNKNMFISPTSISTALAMTLNGAEGTTKSEMLETMQIESWTIENANAAFKALLEIYPSLDQAVQLKIANAIFYDTGFPVYDSFLDINANYFDSEVNEIDFRGSDAVPTINSWVDLKTNGLIESIIETIPPDVIMYLINAIYFKGDWTTPFDPEATFPESFFINDAEMVSTDMMHQGEMEMAFVAGDNFKGVDLAYGDSIFSMALLLPNADATLDDLINEMNASNWDDWMERLGPQKVELSMPKFTMEYKKELADVLKVLGMEAAFNSALSDFSNLGDRDDMYIENVIHKTFIEVDELGTEAAAVTAVSVGIESINPDLVYLKFNRPYVFVIRENKSNSVIFVGKMMNPAE